MGGTPSEARRLGRGDLSEFVLAGVSCNERNMSISAEAQGRLREGRPVALFF